MSHVLNQSLRAAVFSLPGSVAQPWWVSQRWLRRVVGFSSLPFSQLQPQTASGKSINHYGHCILLLKLESMVPTSKNWYCSQGTFTVFLRAPPLKQTGPVTNPVLRKRSWSRCSHPQSLRAKRPARPLIVSLVFSPSTTLLPPGIPTPNWTPEQLILGQGWGQGASRS